MISSQYYEGMAYSKRDHRDIEYLNFQRHKH